MTARSITAIVFLWLFAAGAWAQIPIPTDAPKPRAPEETVASYRLREGFYLELVASEPLLASPSAVCWDERGRMFVCELHGYNLEGQLDIEELNKTGRLDTEVRRVQADEKFKKAAEGGTYGVVKLLRDTNQDGRMDEAQVWATNLPPAYGIVPARGGVIVAAAPDILWLADRDGDGRAEIQEKLFTGFRTGALERGVNAPQWGMDGWIYFGRGWGGGQITGPKLAQPISLPDSDFRIKPDGSAIEPVTGRTHTFGFAMLPAGDRFVVTTAIPGIYIAPLPWHYLARNPNAVTPALDAAAGDRRAFPLAKPHPWRQKRAEHAEYFKYYSSRYGAAESEPSGWFTSLCGAMVYRDDVLPGLQGQYFVCEPAGNLIHRALIERQGPVLTLRRAPGEEQAEFAASADSWSHPMNLTHGPDGRIWIVDYYREIIEDYSAIPRHLQQQYGLYAGHDRGRIYRLTHRQARTTPSADMSGLSPNALAQECASPLLWRRQTAQRLLVERDANQAGPELRKILSDRNNARVETIIAALRTMELLGELGPLDLLPFLGSGESAARVQALQLADRWLGREEGHDLLEAALTAAATEKDERILLQLALSLGEARDPRAFKMLVRLAREKMDIRWMDAAVLSSIAGREVELLAELLRAEAHNAGFLARLSQTIAARQNSAELARVLKLLGYAAAEAQHPILDGLAKGRRNAASKWLPDAGARAALTNFMASASTDVAQAARALSATFTPAPAEDEGASTSSTGPAELVSEAKFRQFLSALAGPRDLKRGREIFEQSCATCHKIGNEGFEVGPDLLSQTGLSEESLLQDILNPSQRIRPGYEIIEVLLKSGAILTGLLKDEGPTSVTIAQAAGVQQEILRMDLAEMRRLPVSLMPSFSETLTPADASHLLAWLKAQRAAPIPGQ